MAKDDQRFQEYNEVFYDSRKVDRLLKGAELVASFLGEFHQPGSVVDIGCGRGHWLAAFHNAGAKRLVGIDGPWNEGKAFICPDMAFSSQDLESGVTVGDRFDLAVCLGVIEQITPEAGDRLIATLCQSADVVLFAAAIVAQPGVRHINCQYPSYWHERFKGHGFACFDVLRPKFWNDPTLAPHYQQNLLLYVNEGSAGSGELRRKLEPYRVAQGSALDLVHPFVYEIQVNKFQKTRAHVKKLEREQQKREQSSLLARVPVGPVIREADAAGTAADIALVTANIGGYDSIKDISAAMPALRELGVSTHFFTDSAAEVGQAAAAGWGNVYLLEKQLARLDPRMRAKFFKLRPHRIAPLAEYGRFVWMDASLKLEEPDALIAFIKAGTECEGEEIIQAIPHSRKTLLAEFQFIMENLESSAYLQKVAKVEPVKDQLEFYKDRQVDLNIPLYIGSLFFRTLSPRLNEMCDFWWDLNVTHSSRDQLSLPVALSEYGIKPHAIHVNFSRGIVRKPHQGVKKQDI